MFDADKWRAKIGVEGNEILRELVNEWKLIQKLSENTDEEILIIIYEMLKRYLAG